MRSARSVSLALALVAGLLEQLIFAYHSSLGALSDQHLQPEQGVQGPLVRKENSPASAVVLAPPWADAETSAAEVSADGGVRTDSDLSWRREHQHHHQSWAKQGEELLHGVPSSPRASSSGKTSFEGPSRASSTSSTSLEGSTRKGRSSSGTTEQGRSTGGVGARNDDSTGGNGARSDVSTGGDKESRRASLSGTSSSDTTSSLQNDKEEDHSGKRTRRTTSERTETRVDPPTTADNDLNSAPIDDGTTTSDPVDGLDQASAQATNTTTTTPLMPDFQNTAGDCVYASLSSCNTGLSAGYNHSSWVTSQQNASDEDMMNFTNTTNPEANRVFVARFKGSATATDQHLTLGDCCFYQGQAKIGFESAQTGLSSLYCLIDQYANGTYKYDTGKCRKKADYCSTSGDLCQRITGLSESTYSDSCCSGFSCQSRENGTSLCVTPTTVTAAAAESTAAESTVTENTTDENSWS